MEFRHVAAADRLSAGTCGDVQREYDDDSKSVEEADGRWIPDRPAGHRALHESGTSLEIRKHQRNRSSGCGRETDLL